MIRQLSAGFARASVCPRGHTGGANDFEARHQTTDCRPRSAYVRRRCNPYLGRTDLADALRRLFLLAEHISPLATDLAFNGSGAPALGLSPEEAIARSEKAQPDVIRILEGQLANA